ncbi:Deoxyribose-phosphate aldolase [subsurface metagenome]
MSIEKFVNLILSTLLLYVIIKERRCTMTDKDIEKRLIAAPIEPEMTEKKIREFASELNKYDYYSVIVDEYNLDLTFQLFKKNRVGLIVSYPLGGMTTETKVRLTEIAVKKGCSEINVCPNYNALKSGDFKTVKNDLKAVFKAANGKLDVVAVPQVSLMTLEEIKKICDICLEIGIYMFKTNSGMNLGKSELEHIQYMRRLYGDRIKIEVSGGVRNLEQAQAFVKASADRVHSSTWKQVIGAED